MDEDGASDDDSVNDEIQEACRQVLGLQKEKTLLTLAEFYAPTPDVRDRTTDEEGNTKSTDDNWLSGAHNHNRNEIMSQRARSRAQSRPGSRRKSENQSSEKCVGNHYHDLDVVTRTFIDVEVEKDLHQLGVPHRTDIFADISINGGMNKDQREPLENAKYCFSNLVKTNRAFLTRVKHDRTKQTNPSVNCANNFALVREPTSLNYKHFDFVPVRTEEGKNKYLMNDFSPSHLSDRHNSSCGEERQYVIPHWRGHQTPSKAPLIALQRSKTIYRNQYLPAIHKASARNQNDRKMEKHVQGNKDMTVDFSHSKLHTRRAHPGLGMPVSRHYLPSLPSLTTVNSSCGNSLDSLSTGFSGFSKDSNIFSANSSWNRRVLRPTPEIFYTYQDPPINTKTRRDLKMSPYLEESFDNNSEERPIPILLGRSYNEEFQ